ncbi:glucose-inhibited division protein B [Oceanobacillus iheyensis HTE831]|uniref:Ribosomal RNA small subunit methyltransferase G n=1 Tax=Oceanobacillus iheyensis (strain DSM 14371 / CIP 107618 / JCM 11309 / KCTC 3954 / HTE831) TaxID=221109 RepID=RSMG_OCEIH|nr:16S rRNA (guanine(527)-N(7))-methyltransferase RsmG [Oceanobacillus iheyensis]Q8EKU4.1 RecName: Full=Ribosomal RNA small subunit methyltransferase G; AltName: Full=16S rRNA 7-methylguanosine methyltransferase; Short=16S rRNA m7G methyltransferase [Oceanobacillus iheyensis HTE831]BAC15445.1 glucose-inhibited division protein B [Oceanobacillus iheyensis HTE831]
MKPEQFVHALKEKGINLSEKQTEQFYIYFQELVEWNQKVNLTAITDQEEVYVKHFYDCVTAAFYHDFNQEISICDIGAGAGFPSIPLKIVFPQLKITIVDSLKKRITFLNHLATKLELSNVAFYHDRAENFGKNKTFRESFDIVTARAVARMSVLSELCLPLVKKNGVFIAMKGAQAKEELEVGKPAIELLGGEVEEIHTFSLPIEESERSIILISKKRQTPKKYPRKAGLPNKEPIE